MLFCRYILFALFLVCFGGGHSFAEKPTITIELMENDKEIANKALFLFKVFSNTLEIHSHQMNGADDNVIYFNKETGQETVFGSDGKSVEDCENKASGNYAHPIKDPFNHFFLDSYPWIMFGNCPEDKTNRKDRVKAYLKDFQVGMERAFSDSLRIPNEFSFEENSDSIYKIIEMFEEQNFDLYDFIANGGNTDVDKQRALLVAFGRAIMKGDK